MSVHRVRFSALVLSAASLAALGCASNGFNRGALRDELSSGPRVVTDAEIEKALAARPQLPKPFRLGVYFHEPSDAGRWNAPKWRWTEEDKAQLIASVKAGDARSEISDAFLISDVALAGARPDLKSLRLAAARHGADALLVVVGAADADRYLNGWAWSYVALAPMFFAPGNVVESLFVVRAALWDVRNEFLYMTADLESVKKQIAPLSASEPNEAAREAKVEALGKLKAEILKTASAPSRSAVR